MTNPILQKLRDLIAKGNVTEQQKQVAEEILAGAEKDYDLLKFKLERTEKDRETLSIMLEESVQDVQKKAATIEKANTELQEALENLKATQTQLIHAEKMASLGELTAGIAHEIQNPLNFINNFSEINADLVNELQSAVEERDFSEIADLLKNIRENEEKIVHHGKRADSIVKNMLLHSRSNANVKEPTDINALADEYLRLSYHGMRAKDKSFNATMNTDFDPSVGKIEIVMQAVGRVLLNLINNAFYAVMHRCKSTMGAGFEPTVSLSTKRTGNEILLVIEDNGCGIPDKIKDKIFQPFFTTKPTGEGTGLGLSLSYEIIKTHGGDIEVESSENKGTKFTIHLPSK